MADQQYVDLQVGMSSGLRGEMQVPGDKSISHRAVMIAAIAQGETSIDGFLFAADNMATVQAFRQMGVSISEDRVQNRLVVHGVGREGLQAALAPLDMGNSGTAMRLLAGLLAGQNFSSTLVGDVSLSKRPMQRVAEPLRKMGASISLSDADTAPVTINPVPDLYGIDYQLSIASAQVKSALLLAAIYARGETRVSPRGVMRDHTERMLQTFNYPLVLHDNMVTLKGQCDFFGTTVQVPADISSAAFFIVAASITPGSDILLPNVGVNLTRAGIIDVLRLMGADIVVENSRYVNREPIADIRVRYAPLYAIDIPSDIVPVIIDELPVLLVAAACAAGVTRLTNAQELRVKESDRLSAMDQGLKALGVTCEVQHDGMIVEGGSFSGGVVDSFDDHRIAMAFVVAGCVASNTVTIRNCKNIQTSFPQFVAQARALGFCIN